MKKETLKDFAIAVIRDENITKFLRNGCMEHPEWLEVAVWNPDMWDYDYYFSYETAHDILKNIDEEYLDYIVTDTDFYLNADESILRIEITKSI